MKGIIQTNSIHRLRCLWLILVTALAIVRIGAENSITQNKPFITRRLRSVKKSSTESSRVLGDGSSSDVTSASKLSAGRTLASGANDDMFQTSAEAQRAQDERKQKLDAFLKEGSCDNIECRVFLLVGYVTVGVGIAAAYRLARSSEWSVPPSVTQYEMRGAGQSLCYDDEMTLGYRRKQWGDSKTVN